LPDPSELYALPRMLYPRVGHSTAAAGRMMPVPITAAVLTTATTTITSTVAASAAQAGLVYTSFTGPGAPTSGTYTIRPMYGAVDHQYHIGLTFVDPRRVGVYGYPDARQAEVRAIGGVPVGTVGYPEPSGRPEQGSLGERAGAVPRCEPVTGGGYGARSKEARTTGYYGYVGVPTDVSRADQATVSGRVGWMGQAIVTGYRKPGGQVEPTVPDGRRAGIDTARVAGSNIDTASRTPSVWAGVEPAKLYTGVGTSYLDAGTTGVPQPVYLRQPIQLRLAAPIQLASGQFYHPLVFDPSAGTAPAPNWNRPVESWV